MVFECPSSCAQLLAAMVGIDTVNHHISARDRAEEKLAAYLDRVARAFGLETRAFPVPDAADNLLVTCPARPGGAWLLFESHMDTVSVEGMTVDPFAAAVRGGRMYGRGACDTKASGAAMLWALREYSAQAERPNNVAIAYTVDEEIGKAGVRAFTGGQLQQLSWKPSAVVVGEPTGLRPVVAHNGIVRWKICTRGVAAHSGDPSKGRNAISMMARVIEHIERRYIASLQTRHPLTGRAQCSINLIRGGTQVNIIPSHCEIEIDRRLVPGEDGTAVVPAVERVLEELRHADPRIVVEQQKEYVDPPLDPAGGEAFAGHVGRLLESLGLPGQGQGVYYGTDASQFSELGIPALVLGPGSIEQAHTEDEWLELEQLERAVEVYRTLMETPWENAR